jgi:putative endonuclease
MAFFCYMLECADGSYYTGWTTDPARRERQHNRGAGARYTRTRSPVRLVYVEPQPDRRTALLREIALKKLTHAQKRALVINNSLHPPAPSSQNREEGEQILSPFSAA